VIRDRQSVASCARRPAPDTRRPPNDQAAGLRRLFAPRGPRFVPILVPAGENNWHATWIARLAEAFVRAGDRTLLADAARLQIAASLGLRARFDLAHVLAGECTIDQLLLDAAPQLTVFPASRALEHSADHAGLTRAVAAVAYAREIDLVLLALRAEHTPLIAGEMSPPEYWLPMGREADAQRAALHALRVARDTGDIETFRLLFPGMDAAAAATLFSRLAASGARQRVRLRFGGVARTARDLVSVVRAAAGWDINRLADKADTEKTV